ncbi:hypothetical protein EDB85DRAFT_2118879 [Lactarius pseudohatsudake]|nr:hypothetical protein EDB85DRAFT_2118879 [Lactarius pseudohatsudake]
MVGPSRGRTPVPQAVQRERTSRAARPRRTPPLHRMKSVCTTRGSTPTRVRTSKPTLRCGRMFVSPSARAGHFESGTCASWTGSSCAPEQLSQLADNLYRCLKPACASKFATLSVHVESGSCGAGLFRRVRKAMDSWTRRLQV